MRLGNLFQLKGKGHFVKVPRQKDRYCAIWHKKGFCSITSIWSFEIVLYSELSFICESNKEAFSNMKTFIKHTTDTLLFLKRKFKKCSC